MKTISLKKFRKSAERMTRSQYEKESGNETKAPEVYSYLHFLHIEIYPLRREVGEPMKELYVVHTSDTFETEDLKEAEKFLYNTTKTELPKKEKKEKFDPKMPNGLDSYLDSFYQISTFIGFQSDRYIRGRVVLKANDSVRTFLDEFTPYEQGNKVKEFTTQFEQIIYELEKTETVFGRLEQIDLFCSEEFQSERKEIEMVKNPITATEYEVASYMGRLGNENNEIFDALDGADGQHTKAVELSKEFDLKYKDAMWGENGLGGFYEEIDQFLYNAFAPMKTFCLDVTNTVSYRVHIEARSLEEAKETANKTKAGFVDGEESWEIEEA